MNNPNQIEAETSAKQYLVLRDSNEHKCGGKVPLKNFRGAAFVCVEDLHPAPDVAWSTQVQTKSNMTPEESTRCLGMYVAGIALVKSSQ